MLSPDDHLVFRPLPAQMPVPGANTLNVHLSGLSTGQLVYLKRLLRAIGGQLSLKLNRQTTHLVCSTVDTLKARKAPEWGVQVVRDSWLLAMGRSGKVEPSDPHRHLGAPPVMEARRLGSVNMSAVSELGEPSYEAKSSPHSAPTPGRQLGLTPTHIDKNGNSSIAGSTADINASAMNTSNIEPSNILSPPKHETERLLNHASRHEMGGGGKVLKTSSAPESDSLRTEMNGTGLKSASTGGTGGGFGKKDVTEVLRQLAEGVDTTLSGRQKVVSGSPCAVSPSVRYFLKGSLSGYA